MRWLEAEKNMSPRTLEAYMADVRDFIGFMTEYRGHATRLTDLSDASLGDFRAWLTSLVNRGLAKSSRSRSLAGLRNFYRWLDRSGRLHNTAITFVTTPRRDQPIPKAMTVKDALDLLELSTTAWLGDEPPWLGRRDRALFTLLYGAGLRISEALQLDRDVVPLGDLLRIDGKGSKQRMVPLLPLVREEIDAYLDACPYSPGADGPLFVGAKGGRLAAAVAQRRMRTLRDMAGFSDSVTPHALRHSFATHLLSEGANLREIQDLLGHASLSTTMRYTDVDTDSLMRIHAAAHPRSGARKPEDAG
jgi:integrase/recombinase XerC